MVQKIGKHARQARNAHSQRGSPTGHVGRWQAYLSRRPAKRAERGRTAACASPWSGRPLSAGASISGANASTLHTHADTTAMPTRAAMSAREIRPEICRRIFSGPNLGGAAPSFGRGTHRENAPMTVIVTSPCPSYYVCIHRSTLPIIDISHVSKQRCVPRVLSVFSNCRKGESSEKCKKRKLEAMSFGRIRTAAAALRTAAAAWRDARCRQDGFHPER